MLLANGAFLDIYLFFKERVPMRSFILLSLLFVSSQVFALDLINNTNNSVTININGNSGSLKPGAIVDYRPPNLKAPLNISASGKRNSGKAFNCHLKINNIKATVVIPEDMSCR